MILLANSTMRICRSESEQRKELEETNKDIRVMIILQLKRAILTSIETIIMRRRIALRQSNSREIIQIKENKTTQIFIKPPSRRRIHSPLNKN